MAVTLPNIDFPASVSSQCNNTITLSMFDLKGAFELRQEFSNNVVCATSKASDQPVHMRIFYEC